MTTTKLGLDGKAYVSTTTHDDGGSITWSEFDLIESIEHEHSKAEATARNRSSKYGKTAGGTRTVSYTLTATYDASDAVITLLQNAFYSDTVIALAVMDGDITTSGEKGFYMDVEVVSAPKPEELDEIDSIQFKVVPAIKSTFEPTRVTIA